MDMSVMMSGQGLALLAVLGVYLLAIRYLRFQRRNQIQSTFANRPLSSMTVQEAHEIMRQLRELEFPWTMRSSTRLSTLKTGSIPTVTKLFLATGQRSPTTNTKRAADTEVLMNEIHDRPAGSDSQLLGFARMNYMHSRYRKAGKILDEDMVHTLGSALVDIYRSVEAFEWRALTQVEVCAVGVFHKAMGDAMEIPYDLLPSSKVGWKDGVHFAREICEFTREYEERAARPTESTLLVSRRLMELETVDWPGFLKGVVERVIAMRLDERVRVSMGYEKPGPILSSIVSSTMAVRRFILRYLSPPRPSFLAVQGLNMTPDADTGRYMAKQWTDNPWYIKPTFLNRWGLKAMAVRLFGTGNVPEQNGPYRSEGYDLRTIGPSGMENKGQAEVQAIFADLKKRNIPSGCPFHA